MRIGGFTARRARRPRWLVPALVGVVSALLLYWVELAFRNANRDILPKGYLLQEWSSEDMMQTLALADMFRFGPSFFIYEHIYPPLQDILRYFWSLPELLHATVPNYAAVDMNLYKTYCVCFGIVNAVVYLWVRDLTRSGWWAGGITILWAIAPGYLTCMMLLDSTPLALAGLAVAYYLLYRFLRTRNGWYAAGFLAGTLVASLARNITQAHVLLFLAAFVIAVGFLARGRRLLPVLVSIGLFLLILVLPVKQYVMFGTLDTSTFSGIHRVGMLWLDPHTVPEPEFPADILGNGERLQSKYNTTDAIRDNYRLGQGAYSLLVTEPWTAAQGLVRSLGFTIPAFLAPESSYADNLLVARLPWKDAYDWVFSSWRYVLIAVGSIAIVGFSRGARGSAALIRRYGWLLGFWVLVALPVIWSNRWIIGREAEGPAWTDAARLKVFLEVPMVALLGYASWLLASRLRARLAASRTATSGGAVDRPDERVSA